MVLVSTGWSQTGKLQNFTLVQGVDVPDWITIITVIIIIIYDYYYDDNHDDRDDYHDFRDD